MTEAEILAAIDGLTPALQRAYLDQVRAMVDAAVIADVERLIAERDDSGVVQMLAAGAFAALLEGVRAAFIKGGTAIVIKRPGGVPVQFDQHSAPAQDWVTSNAQKLTQAIAQEQAQAIQVMLAAGRQSDRTAREIALDIVGRVSPQTGKRVGGVLGLSGAEAEAVANTGRWLTSGQLDQMGQYLKRADRDKRLDGIVKRAIEAEKPVAKVDAERIKTVYADRKLKAHAELVARSQAHKAYNAGFNRLHRQLMEQHVKPVSITKGWNNKGDKRVRHAHVELGGVEVPIQQPFQSPTGAQLDFPGDDAHGASWADLANCRCTVKYKVRWK
ncbi:MULTISPECIES: phage minor head protein [unclassified Pseudomonas]|uniref:phage minor head protein n=1 Tax=unclassified Pseudomonas TaxID=196821 RepID=UPI000BD680CF|nr:MULTISPECIES: phage minor head protein [unclassified Pseudomonas]PVZ19927.1 phage Mu protein F like protein [Pseudomonas sp. URIL14HWK12:I12]PVZ26993.1 phage Mu protein F like protein [Pseudomonas sp. URIL14HWK12:I10]PVZ37882.1 phage Mu protein F like protein [Pseudomonas sp. URIL14HWK12:I11]SNZ05290.1 Phage Mu protein F like protein [Pseudomonas sp. URIL14HWK12:I9]